jgi:hypothetical protein
MTKAKHLHGAGKTDVVRTSFENKLKKMDETLKRWKKTGKRDDSFWPKSLVELKSWDEPGEGIFKWTSNNITLREGEYSKQVERYWRLQEKAAPIPKVDEGAEPSRLKRENVRLSQQINELTWEVMDLRDELIRIDPKNTLLARVLFP